MRSTADDSKWFCYNFILKTISDVIKCPRMVTTVHVCQMVFQTQEDIKQLKNFQKVFPSPYQHLWIALEQHYREIEACDHFSSLTPTFPPLCHFACDPPPCNHHYDWLWSISFSQTSFRFHNWYNPQWYCVNFWRLVCLQR